ncbi:hypothetical protein [Microvirga antarctica]|uniref:hypothetical protein n=1 Tax=Microvirga antarctica TaxID=2819233 RepID=UPI001B309FD2|nr:hypothetical protein [Microvirga antarctica]
MPTELPPRKKSEPTLSLPQDPWFDKSLNWLAVMVGIGLCVWAITFGINAPPSLNSPSQRAATSAMSR